MANTEQALKDALSGLLEQTQGADDCVMDPTAYKEAQRVATAALTAAQTEAQQSEKDAQIIDVLNTALNALSNYCDSDPDCDHAAKCVEAMIDIVKEKAQ